MSNYGQLFLESSSRLLASRSPLEISPASVPLRIDEGNPRFFGLESVDYPVTEPETNPSRILETALLFWPPSRSTKPPSERAVHVLPTEVPTGDLLRPGQGLPLQAIRSETWLAPRKPAMDLPRHRTDIALHDQDSPKKRSPFRDSGRGSAFDPPSRSMSQDTVFCDDRPLPSPRTTELAVSDLPFREPPVSLAPWLILALAPCQLVPPGQGCMPFALLGPPPICVELQRVDIHRGARRSERPAPSYRLRSWASKLAYQVQMDHLCLSVPTTKFSTSKERPCCSQQLHVAWT